MGLWTRPLESGSIRTRLMGALVVLALLPILVLGVSLGLLELTAGGTRQVNLAGSLRMRSFVIAAQLSSYLASPAEFKRQTVEVELGRMQTTLDALENGSDSLHVAPVRDAEVRVSMVEARRALTAFRELTRRVFAEVDRGTLTPARRDQAAHEVLHAAYSVLALANTATQDLELRSTAAVHGLAVLQAVAVGTALFVTLLTLWATHRYVLQPIPSLLAAFDDVQAGRYGVHVDVSGNNEFANLAHAFNSMSTALEKAHHDLVLQQAEILEKNAALERANKLKSEFVANMSHELRTPLNAIIGYTRLLQRGVYGALPAALHEPLAGVDETAGALLTLINDILDVAKIEVGKMDMHLESFRLEDLVREVGEMLRPLAVAKGLDLVVEEEGDGLPAVTSDRDKVRRVLLNLGGNAVKFTRRGSVRLKLLQPGDAGFEVAVQDTGIGIAPADLETIFEDFRQLDGSSTREQGGTGLGLAISRRLARHLGGDIRVESHVGIGSIFTLRLPAAPPVPTAASRGPVS